MFAEVLRSRCGADLSEAQVQILQSHYELLVRWNRTLNLTKIVALEEAVERHYCESLFLAHSVEPASVSIVDIGSGPGFPGFPVAVLRPDCSVTLVESHQRKAVFLREASRALPNIRVVAKRAEDVTQIFDWAVSRAVSYDDLAGSLPRLASKAALLTGADEPPPKFGFVWGPAVPVGSSCARYLRVGRRLGSFT